MQGSSGRAVEHRTVNRGDGGSIPPTAVSKLRQYRSPPHLPVSFGRDTKSRWSLLSGVYARGSKRSHTGGKYVTCSGFTNSRWTLNALEMAPSSIWEKEERKNKQNVCVKICPRWVNNNNYQETAWIGWHGTSPLVPRCSARCREGPRC